MKWHTWAPAALSSLGVVAIVAVAVGVVRLSPPEPVPDTDRQTLPTVGDQSYQVRTYLITDTVNGPKLIRNDTFALADKGKKLQAAIAAVVTGTSFDHDYRSAFPQGSSVRIKETSDGTLLVDLSGIVPNVGYGEGGALAAEALRRTIASNGGPSDYVVAINGRPIKELMGAPLQAPLNDQVLAPVEISAPAEGARLGTRVAIAGKVASPDAVFNWAVVNADGVVVKKGLGQAQSCCTRSPYNIQLELPPGSYQVMVSSLPVGKPDVERSEVQVNIDTKNFEVR